MSTDVVARQRVADDLWPEHELALAPVSPSVLSGMWSFVWFAELEAVRDEPAQQSRPLRRCR